MKIVKFKEQVDNRIHLDSLDSIIDYNFSRYRISVLFLNTKSKHIRYLAIELR